MVRTQKYLLICVSVVALACLGLVLARIYLFNDSRDEAYSGPLEPIIIGNIGEYSIFNIIAEDRGYFAANGLAAKITEYESGPATLADVVAGEIDLGIAADFVVVSNILDGQDLKIVTQASKQKIFNLVARTDHRITTPADLKGKRVGVTRKSAGEFFLGRFLTFQNLGLNDIIIVDLPPSEIVMQLTNGDIDAALIFDPHAYNLKQNLGDTVVVWPAQAEQNNFVVAYSSAEYIVAHPNIIKRYLQALLQAEQYVKEYPIEAQALIAQHLDYDPDYMAYMWPHSTFELGLDQELLLTMEDQTRWLIENSLTTKTVVPNYLDNIYFDALESIQPQDIKIIR